MRSLVGAILDKAPIPYTTGRGALAFPVAAQTDMPAQMRAMSSVGTLFAIVNRTSNATSQVDWHLYRPAKSGKEEDRTEVTSHLALDIWNNPNPFFSRQRLVEAGQQHVDLTGEGWLVVVRNPKVRSIPLELWPVRPDRMSPVPHPEDFIAGYTYTAPGGEVVPLETDSVLRLMMPNPLDPYRGMGPVQSIMVDLDAQRYSAEWNRNFFVNSAAPGGIIEVDKRLSDDDFAQMVTRWREAHQGVGNAHRVAVLEQGKWVPASYSMRDMQFTELRRVAREVILEAFGMSKFAVGDITDVNRATADAAAVWFARYLTVPRLERWKALLNGPYLALFGAAGRGLEFDYDNPVPEDEAAELAEMSAKATAQKSYIDAGWEPESVKEGLGLPDALTFKEEPPPAPVPPGLAQPPPPVPGAPVPPQPPTEPGVAEAAVALLARVLLAEARAGRDDRPHEDGRFRKDYWS